MFKVSSMTKVSNVRQINKAGKSFRKLSTQAQNVAKPSPVPPPPEKPSKSGGGVFLKVLGVTTVSVGGLIGYAYYDDDFRKQIESSDIGKKVLEVFSYFKTVEPPVQQPQAVTFTQSNVKKATPPVEKIESKSEKTVEKTPKEIPQDKKLAKEKQEKEVSDKEKQKKVVEQRLKAQQEEEAAENAAIEVIIENLIESGKKLTAAAVNAQKMVIETTKSHTESLKQAMDDTSQILNKDEQWTAVADAYAFRDNAVKEAETIKQKAKENLEKLKKTIEDGKKEAATKSNKILKSGQEHLNNLNHELNTISSKVDKAEADSRIMSKYRDLVDKGRKQFQKELESILPDVKLSDKKGKKLTEDELNSLIAHAHRRIDQLQKQLAEQLAVEANRIEAALEIQQKEDEKLSQTRVNMERRRLKDQFSLEKDKWEEDSRVEFELELRQHLSRQAAAHSDHLKEVLKVQEGEIGQQYEREMHTRLIEERQGFQSEVAGWIARLKGIEAAVEARAENEKTARTAQELWLACVSMNGVIRIGKEDGETWEDKLKPLSKETQAISDAASKHPFVEAVLKTVPEEALSRGVFTEDSLRERFPNVKRVCKRVGMIDENGGTLLKYFLSYVQSFFIFDTVVAKSADSDVIDISELDTFSILAHADYYLEKGDLLQAVRFMNQLQGEPKHVASQWIKEAKLLLETRQAAYALMAFASASGLGTIF